MAISRYLVCLLLGVVGITGVLESKETQTPRYRNLWALANPAFRAPFTLDLSPQTLPEGLTGERVLRAREQVDTVHILYDWMHPQKREQWYEQLQKLGDQGLLLLPEKDRSRLERVIPARDLLEYALRAQESPSPHILSDPFPLHVCRYDWGEVPSLEAMLRSGPDLGFLGVTALTDYELNSETLEIWTVFELIGGAYDVESGNLETPHFPLLYTPVYFIQGRISPILTFETWDDFINWLPSLD